MVNVGRNTLSQGEFYPSRENWLRNDRQYIDIPQDGRFTTPSIHGYPQVCISVGLYCAKIILTPSKNVETALRDYAQIPVKEFALIVMQENGEQRTYSSTSLKPHRSKIFTQRFKKDFQQYARWVNTEGSYPNSGQSNLFQQDLAFH
jgi:hypothetical protein